MKIRITMKDPDGVYECVSDAIGESLPKGLSSKESEALSETRRDEVYAVLGRWFRYHEYLTVEVDTEAKTIAVLESES